MLFRDLTGGRLAERRQGLGSARSVHTSLPRRFSAGTTYLELIIVVAIITILVALVLPFVATSTTSRGLAAESSIAADILSQAQFGAMSGKKGYTAGCLSGRFGVHFQATRYVFFCGTTYSSADVNNDVHILPADLSITAVTLGGSCTLSTGVGACDVHFASPKGTPTETGSVTFAGTGATKTLTVNAVGMIDVN